MWPLSFTQKYDTEIAQTESVYYQHVDRREQKEQFLCRVNFLAQQKGHESIFTAHAPDSSAL